MMKNLSIPAQEVSCWKPLFSPHIKWLMPSKGKTIFLIVLKMNITTVLIK